MHYIALIAYNQRYEDCKGETFSHIVLRGEVKAPPCSGAFTCYMEEQWHVLPSTLRVYQLLEPPDYLLAGTGNCFKHDALARADICLNMDDSSIRHFLAAWTDPVRTAINWILDGSTFDSTW